MFNRIEAKNMFSWAELDFNIESGTTLIDGFNYDDGVPEGSGKSSIPNILCWTLFGKIPKDVKIDEVIRQGTDSCIAKVTLDDGAEIIRSRKPNVLKYINRDGEVIVGKDAKETQSLIEKVIGFSFETFCQSVYFAQNYPKRFITADETEKSKILSELQDLEIFDRAKAQITKKVSALNKTLITSNSELKVLAARLESMETLLVEKTNTIKHLESKQPANLDITVLSSDLDAIRAANAESEKLETSIISKKNELKVTENKLKANYNAFKVNEETLTSYQKELNQIQEAVSANRCPVCEGKLEEAHANKVSAKINELESKMDKLITKRNDLLFEEADLKKVSYNVEELDAQLQIVKDERKQFWEAIEIISNQIATAKLYENDKKELIRQKSDFARVKTDLAAIKTEFVTKHEAQEAVLAEVQALDILSDSMKQVKSYVFRNLLIDISSKATEIALQLFEVPVSIQFYNDGDDGEATKIKVNVIYDGVERSLGLLSGGQARRVQLATDLALAQIIGRRANNPVSFRIFDEITKDLSETSMEKVLSLLKGMNGSNLLIEHNSMAKTLVDNVYHVELRNKVSNAT